MVSHALASHIRALFNFRMFIHNRTKDWIDIGRWSAGKVSSSSGQIGNYEKFGSPVDDVEMLRGSCWICNTGGSLGGKLAITLTPSSSSRMSSATVVTWRLYWAPRWHRQKGKSTIFTRRCRQSLLFRTLGQGIQLAAANQNTAIA